jgi:hypothetical protein
MLQHQRHLNFRHIPAVHDLRLLPLALLYSGGFSPRTLRQLGKPLPDVMRSIAQIQP